MANVKSGAYREVIIDRCLQSRRGHSTQEIVDKCNAALERRNETPITALNTIRNDILSIENRWHIEVEQIRSGREIRYRYKDPHFSIYNTPLNKDEIAQAPLIVSASRSTDIPAFYADWFFDRLEKGYSAWTNPFNGVKSYVSYDNTRFIVFWSKNPRPLLPYLHILKERNIKCYVQYTLNDYEQEKLEKVPPLASRIETFKLLVEQLGKGAVIWRFDPMILTDDI